MDVTIDQLLAYTDEERAKWERSSEALDMTNAVTGWRFKRMRYSPRQPSRRTA